MKDRLIRNSHGERLAHAFTPARGSAHTHGGKLMIVSHGVTSQHERPYLVQLCEALADVGIASLRFTFSGNGDSEGRFEDCCISKEVEDLGAVIDALEGEGCWKLAYTGHSMGGAVGVIRAAQDPRLRALVCLAGMVEVQGFMQRHFKDLVPGVDCMLGREHAKLSASFLEDSASIGTTLGWAGSVTVPWLLVHGTADELVPFEESQRCEEVSAGTAQLIAMEGSDHCFEGQIETMVRHVVGFADTAY